MSTTRILVAEDEEIVAMSIEYALVQMGYTVTAVVPSGEAAVQKAGETTPDLILMDIRLVGQIDGIEAASQIRSQLDLPVIFLTAYADQGTLQRAKMSQPYGYLLKPFEEVELYTTIEMAVYKHQLERKLKTQQQWFATTLRSIGDAIITTDTARQVTFLNQSAEQLTGWTEAQAVGRPLTEICPIVYEESGQTIDEISEADFGQPLSFTEDKPVLLITKDQRRISVLVNFAPIQDENTWLGLVLALQDNTERRAAQQKLAKAAEEQQKLIAELQAAMAQIKTLHGLIPICASCKKIRDDRGYWHQVETYLSHHSDAQFSHGLCPDCFETLYPDFLKDQS